MMLMQDGKEPAGNNEAEGKKANAPAVIEKKEVKAALPESAVAADAEAKPEAGAKRPAARRAPKKAIVAVEERLLFQKYNLKDVVISDPSLANYITLNPKVFPSTFGRRKDKVYFVTHVNIVERLMNKMMRGGTGQKIGGKVIRTKGALQGKKIKVMRIRGERLRHTQQEDREEPRPAAGQRARERGADRGHHQG